jgi:hypothetical protein
MDLIPPEDREHPWHYGIWDGKVTVAFGYAEYGWIPMAIMTTTFNRSMVVHCSEVFDPFPDMQRWLEQIAGKQLPADWEIDEEGKKTLLRVKADKDDQLDFQIWRYSYPENPKYPPQFKLRARIERVQLLMEFYRRFTQYVREDFDPQHWPMEPDEIRAARENILDLRHVDLSMVLKEIERVSDKQKEFRAE